MSTQGRPDHGPRVLMIAGDNYMIDRRIMQSAISLRDYGYEVTVVCGMECPDPGCSEIQGIPVHRFQFDWSDPRSDWIDRFCRRGRRLNILSRRIQSKAGRYFRQPSAVSHYTHRKLSAFDFDVIHVHDLPLLEVAVSLARQREVPVVFDAHEIYPEQSVFPDRTRRQLRQTEAKYLPDVSLFTTVNVAIADWYAKNRKRRPHTLMNALPEVGPYDQQEARDRLLKATGFPEESRIIMFQGWLSEERNIPMLVEALDLLPENWRLAIVGYGPIDDVLKELSTSKGIDDRVARLGRLEQEELLMLTPGADLGVVPYLPIDLNHELCSPNKFFEFTQHGVPVLAHDLHFFRDMRDRYGVCETTDMSCPQAIAKTILETVEPQIGRLRANCIQASPEYAWNTQFEAIMDQYPVQPSSSQPLHRRAEVV